MKLTLGLTIGAMTTLFGHSLFAQTTNPAPYCEAKFDDGFMAVERYISKVQFGSLTNESGATQAPGSHYIFYNNLAAPNLTKGAQYPISITHDGGASVHYVAVFIDFNKNNIFEPNECVLQQSIHQQVNNPAVANVTIPTTAALGETRMRVIILEDDEFTFAGPELPAPACTADDSGFLDWGETEDYKVNITAGTLAIESLSEWNGFSIYPNPAKDELQIDAKWNVAKLEIYQLNGSVVLSEEMTGKTKINVSSLQSGSYLVRVYSETGTTTQKLQITQ